MRVYYESILEQIIRMKDNYYRSTDNYPTHIEMSTSEYHKILTELEVQPTRDFQEGDLIYGMRIVIKD